MDSHRPLARRPRARNQRGQTIALGAITLLILALVTFITLNVTLSIHQKIKLQNYADAKAFSIAVQEARALNYFAYTNRSIASAYVSMANMHAYMSEAAMLADANWAAFMSMNMVAGMETAQCWCGPIPCRPQHCIHALEATIRGIMFLVKWAGGDLGNSIQELESPFRATMNALNAHILALHGSQQLVRGSLAAFLASGGELAELKEKNVGQAPVTDGNVASLATAAKFEDALYNETDEKKRIMAEIANATRHDFTWNRATNPAAAAVLFAPAMNLQLRDTAGDRGLFVVTQPISGLPVGSAGRTGFTDGEFPGQAGSFSMVTRDPEPGGPLGESLSSFDYGMLVVQWRHGVGTYMLPFLGGIAPGRIVSGESSVHEGLVPVNDPHSGADHDSPTLNLSRFMEFDIGEEPPFNQPAVYAAASTETRVNERGERMVFEVTESGRVTFDVGEAGTGTVQLSNEGTAHAASKAMVYYHRIGDWSDYPNLFNPYWRAKLEPMTLTEAMMVLGAQDGTSAGVVGAMVGMPGGRGAVNVQ